MIRQPQHRAVVVWHGAWAWAFTQTSINTSSSVEKGSTVRNTRPFSCWVCCPPPPPPPKKKKAGLRERKSHDAFHSLLCASDWNYSRIQVSALDSVATILRTPKVDTVIVLNLRLRGRWQHNVLSFVASVHIINDYYPL